MKDAALLNRTMVARHELLRARCHQLRLMAFELMDGIGGRSGRPDGSVSCSGRPAEPQASPMHSDTG